MSRASAESQASRRSCDSYNGVPGLQLGGEGAAAAAVVVLDVSVVSSHQMPSVTGTVLLPWQQQQALPGWFIRDVFNLISETEAHAHAVTDQVQLQLDQGREQLDQPQRQTEVARVQFDQIGVQLSERKTELTCMVQQHRSRMRQLCAK